MEMMNAATSPERALSLRSSANRRLWTVGGHLDSSSPLISQRHVAAADAGAHSAPSSTTTATTSTNGSRKFLSSLSSHALDTTLGKPASSLPVTLFRLRPSTGAVESNEEWEALFGAATDADGRVTSATFPPIAAGTWKLRFDTSAYFQRIGVAKFLYPYVEIVFQVETGQHYHVPLLLSAHGYSTYRGS
ncbi:hydroxyisourate hydrolase [Acanthamoeba castellanii str. Neff]|uniref:hydroxyisourate hydrolase n=1 Tax=Acanthamoeba castellanii (strain ATCC 30010 / Neff) TaxID=1257118 RepID=L8GXR9_ACACF|nr:hydroxyisourate hydrolase [Acanthamoeba castellanii str. Neff]ELR16881.1 hydroxyisourate hydrolase [Acanthamoeba castellanii str. Neff]